jgi:hypothetical protein
MPTRDEQVDDFLTTQGVTRRATWGARAPKKTLDPDWGYTVIALHHSGHSAETDPVAVQNKHMDSRGWDDVGYHLMVHPSGTVYEGRRLTAKGSHIELQNTGKVGILVMGDFEGWEVPLIGGLLGLNRTGGPSAKQIEAVRKLIPAVKRLFPTVAVLSGHRDWDPGNQCPGRYFYPQIAGLRKDFGLAAPPPVKK